MPHITGGYCPIIRHDLPGVVMTFSKRFFCAVLLFSVSALATEIDDITGYYVPLKDSADAINRDINGRLEQAVKHAKDCSEKEMFTKVTEVLAAKGWVAKVFQGGVEESIIAMKDVERVHTHIDQSIYAETPLARSAIAYFGRLYGSKVLFPSIRVNGVLFGVDKLSHFFDTGLELYRDYLRGKGIMPALEGHRALVAHAIELEETNLGWGITGIKSYGDIQSHMQGAFFWEEFFRSGKWLACVGGKPTLKRKFEIREHFQSGWSEAVQCNEYAGPENDSVLNELLKPNDLSFTDKVAANTAALAKSTGRVYRCPMEPAQCAISRAQLRDRLPLEITDLSRLESPSCRGIVSP